jgi:hypothetical protein
LLVRWRNGLVGLSEQRWHLASVGPDAACMHGVSVSAV